MALRTLLVANRGEIALRVFRTASRLGMETVAVFTDLDADAPHVRGADRALRVESYLDVDGIVEAARTSGADAVHPGYGFLSERAALAVALDEAGITLVGPSARVMEQMGRKDAAREVALAAGVPVVPRGEDAGFPVLVKAAAGGGGKGMRVVREEGDLAEATAAARREAAAAFGDDTMLIEKYVERGRHIEVQILGDSEGNVLHLFERDCSTQRRHQKVIEEAPAPTLTDDVRDRVRQAAVDLASHVGYENAGTVEFLLDEDTNDFYFLEMNTRLQVEHPVTEMISGIDLVELQLRVASGQPLGIRQDEIHLDGHAIEARLYAEDSFNGFLPQAGTATAVHWPPTSSHLRVDHALESGQVVSTAYDPMLGKVIAHGADRESARKALIDALDRTAVLGLTTNAGFLRVLLARDEFREALIDTAWLDRHEVEAPSPERARMLAAWEVFEDQCVIEGPFHSDGWRAGSEPTPVVVQLDEPVVLGQRPTSRPVALVRHNAVEVVDQGQRFVFSRPDAMDEHSAPSDSGTLLAPMPGTVIDVRVLHGDPVEEGQVLGVLEAMKMEHSLRAPFAGTVRAIGYPVGAQVALGVELFAIQPVDSPLDVPDGQSEVPVG